MNMLSMVVADALDLRVGNDMFVLVYWFVIVHLVLLQFSK